MNVDQEFPKRYITSADVDSAGGPVRLRVVDVVVESIGSGNRAQRKPALVFHNTRKVLALNASNLGALRRQLGPETSAWVGAVVTLECVDDKFEGRAVRSIRVVAVAAPALAAPPVAERPVSPPPLGLVGAAFGDDARQEVRRRFSPPPAGLPEDDGLSNGY